MKMEQLYWDILNNLQDGVYFADTERRIHFWNKAAEDIPGYTSEEILGKQYHDSKLNHIDAEGRPLCVVGCPLFGTIVDGDQRTAHVFVRHKDGFRIPISVNTFPIKQDGEIVGAVEVFTQSSPKVYDDDLVKQLSRSAIHDALAILPNRRYLESFLEYKLSEYARFGRLCAALFADIDNFSAFNNTHGHRTDDTVLRNVAASLKSSMRSTYLVGRWSGEEFAGIYSISKPSEAVIIAEKFRHLIECTDVEQGGNMLHVSVSVGISVAHNGNNVHSIIERADSLTYESKRIGKNRVTPD